MMAVFSNGEWRLVVVSIIVSVNGWLLQLYLNIIPLQRKQGDLLQVKMLEALAVHL